MGGVAPPTGKIMKFTNIERTIDWIFAIVFLTFAALFGFGILELTKEGMVVTLIGYAITFMYRGKHES